MHVGMLTEPFADRPVGEVITWAAANGIKAVEVSCRRPTHFNPRESGNVEQLRAIASSAGVRVSALAYYVNLLDPDVATRAEAIDSAKACISACEQLGTNVVCLMGGRAVPGKSKLDTIVEDVPAVYGPLAEFAERHGVRIALENWYQTNLQGLAHFDAFFEAVPHASLGLNFDPSHLVHQQIDHIEALHRYSARIFHVHAKDVEIRSDRLRYLGNLEGGWWRYVIPGFGVIPWGPFVGAVREIGYDDVLSIEHEDRAQAREDGFRRGARFLEQFL